MSCTLSGSSRRHPGFRQWSGNARVRRWRGERRREQTQRPQCHSCCRFFGHEDLQLRARLSRRRCIGVPRAQGPDLSRPIVLNDESTKSQDNSKYWPAVLQLFLGGMPLTWSVFSPAQPATWRNPCWSECYHTSSVPVFAFELHSDVQHAAVVSYSFLYLRVSFGLRASSLALSILGATWTAGRHVAPRPPIPRLSPPREKPVPNISISFAPC